VVWGAVDGLGWICDKHGKLMKEFGWTRDYVRLKITSAQGWVWYNWARQNEATMFGFNWKLSGRGYIGQQIDKNLGR
jgi:hypothetical protein